MKHNHDAGQGPPGWVQKCPEKGKGCMLLYDTLVWRPLRRLYLQGPSFFGVGFWGGAAPPDVCAQLSTVPAAFWAEHPGECEDVVTQHLQSFVVAVETALCAWVAYRTISAGFWHWTVVRPIVHELRALRTDRRENLQLESKDGLPRVGA